MPHRLLLLCLLLVSSSSGQAQEAPSWPRFRGPLGQAVTPDERPLPSDFGPTQKLLWKTALPAGWSSPCIWGERIFLTAYDKQAKKLETLCLQRSNGAILWRHAAPADKIENVYKVNSPASSTPTTDGKHVYVYIGSYGLLCYDYEGKEVWRRPLPTAPIGFGTGTSPILANGLLLLNGQGKNLHLLALDPQTGKTVWTTPTSPYPSDYPVPVLWGKEDAAEVIVPGRGGVMAYHLKDGTRKWWLAGLSPECPSSPTLVGDTLYVVSHLPGGDPDLRMKLPEFAEMLKKHDKDGDGKLSRREIPTDLHIFSRGGKDGVGELHLHQMMWLFDKSGDGSIDAKEWQAMQEAPFNNTLLAIRPGGKGDVSATGVLWKAPRGIPEVPSPLVYRGRLYLIRNGGIVTCLDAASGKPLFPATRLAPGGIYYASPVAGDGKIYLCSDSGVITVLKASDRYEVLAEIDLGSTIRATPALLAGRIYVRTAEHLYAFGETKEP